MLRSIAPILSGLSAYTLAEGTLGRLARIESMIEVG